VIDLADLRDLVPGELTVLGELGGSARSEVHRVRAGTETVVIKRFTGDRESFPREAAALSVLPPGAPAPQLLAVRAEPPTLVLADAGTGPSVADLLLADDPAAARDGLLSWAEAIARLHDCTVDRGAAFRAALADRTDQPVSTFARHIEETAAALDARCADLGVPVPAGAWDDLRGLHARLATGPAALSPGDTCPDNNVATPAGRVLVDFEGAQWCHPAWDVAYLVVPWPTCWCAWRLPDEVAEQALRRYQETSTQAWAGSPDFRADIRAAAAVWAMLTVTTFLAQALADDPPLANPAKRMPTRRSLILNRLAAVESYPAPALSALAEGLRAALVAQWGETPLPYAPAFRS
jgi:aminoglycoside phosphotransferase (APT) family kinase protein